MSKLEIVPLGGIGEFGMNCMGIRYRDEMIVVDAGMGFPEETPYGVDISVPNFDVLDEYKDDITALFLTHGHEDHIGSVPYFLKKFNVPVYGSNLTLAFIERKLSEHKMLDDVLLHRVQAKDVSEVGSFEVDGSMGLRYARLLQSLDSFVTPAGGGPPTRRLSWERKFDGLGPSISVDVNRQIGCSGFSVVGQGGGALLFGKKTINRVVIGDLSPQPATRVLVLDEADEVVGIGEINFGLEWSRQFRGGRNLNIRGLSEETLLGGTAPNGDYVPREFIVPDGMIFDNGAYRKLTSQDLVESGLSSGGLSGQQYWENTMDSEIPEAVMYDASYLKLREIVLAYTIPERIIAPTFFQSASVSFVVRNLAVWSKVPNVDPETFSGSQQAGAIPGYDAGGIPSVRNFALNINLRF